MSTVEGAPGGLGAEGQEGESGEEAHGGRGGRGGQGGQGTKGDKGDPGERYTSWLTRNVVKGYLLLLAGVVVSILLSTYAARENAKRVERDRIADDKAFCAVVNRTYTEINKNRAASRAAYNLLVPPGTDPNARIVKFRDDLLATIDGDLPQLDCSTIGRGERFSLQDAIRNHTLPTPTSTPAPP